MFSPDLSLVPQSLLTGVRWRINTAAGAQSLPQRGGNRAHIVLRRYLNHVHTTRLIPLSAARFAWPDGRQATDHGRSGTRGKTGVQTVDIKGQVTRPIPKDPFYPVPDRQASCLHRRRIKNLKPWSLSLWVRRPICAECAGEMSPLCGVIEHGAVINPLAILCPSIGMGIEMNQ
ncbi:MAG: hypothetical protein CM15mP103_13210 [Gammaproteobacteria bacterium]|nr:MAG: hypothetical protein CM15mP103_13210 [Gammaproteobacteria bacterium]